MLGSRSLKTSLIPHHACETRVGRLSQLSWWVTLAWGSNACPASLKDGEAKGTLSFPTAHFSKDTVLKGCLLGWGKRKEAADLCTQTQMHTRTASLASPLFTGTLVRSFSLQFPKPYCLPRTLLQPALPSCPPLCAQALSTTFSLMHTLGSLLLSFLPVHSMCAQ